VPAPVVHADRDGGAAASPNGSGTSSHPRSRAATDPSPMSPPSTGCRGRPRTRPGRGCGRLPEPEPTAVLGIDETRFRSVRWILDGITWRRSDPWMTSFVDCTPGHPGAVARVAPGRTGGCVREWLGEQSDAFRRRIEIVVIDPSAPYASGIREARRPGPLAGLGAGGRSRGLTSAPAYESRTANPSRSWARSAVSRPLPTQERCRGRSW
jgi:hypothetical protein